MNTILALKFMFAIGTVVASWTAIGLYKRIRKAKTLYPFCEVRRKLIRLLHEGKLSPKSLTFVYLYRFCSDIIHYSQDYRFGSAEFIRMTTRNERDLEQARFAEKLMADIANHDGHVKAVAAEFFNAVINGFWLNSWLLSSTRLWLPIYKVATRQADVLARLPRRLLGADRVGTLETKYAVYTRSKDMRDRLAVAA